MKKKSLLAKFLAASMIAQSFVFASPCTARAEEDFQLVSRDEVVQNMVSCHDATGTAVEFIKAVVRPVGADSGVEESGYLNAPDELKWEGCGRLSFNTNNSEDAFYVTDVYLDGIQVHSYRSSSFHGSQMLSSMNEEGVMVWDVRNCLDSSGSYTFRVTAWEDESCERGCASAFSEELRYEKPETCLDCPACLSWKEGAAAYWEAEKNAGGYSLEMYEDGDLKVSKTITDFSRELVNTEQLQAYIGDTDRHDYTFRVRTLSSMPIRWANSEYSGLSEPLPESGEGVYSVLNSLIEEIEGADEEEAWNLREKLLDLYDYETLMEMMSNDSSFRERLAEFERLFGLAAGIGYRSVMGEGVELEGEAGCIGAILNSAGAYDAGDAVMTVSQGEDGSYFIGLEGEDILDENGRFRFPTDVTLPLPLSLKGAEKVEAFFYDAEGNMRILPSRLNNDDTISFIMDCPGRVAFFSPDSDTSGDRGGNGDDDGGSGDDGNGDGGSGDSSRGDGGDGNGSSADGGDGNDGSGDGGDPAGGGDGGNGGSSDGSEDGLNDDDTGTDDDGNGTGGGSSVSGADPGEDGSISDPDMDDQDQGSISDPDSGSISDSDYSGDSGEDEGRRGGDSADRGGDSSSASDNNPDSGDGEDGKSGQVSVNVVAVKQKVDLKDYFTGIEGICRYTVSSKKMASVNRRGLMKFKKREGTVTVSAWNKKGRDAVKLGEVEFVVEKPEFTSKALRFSVEKKRMDLSSFLKGMNNLRVSMWSSSRPEVAEIEASDGIVTMNSPGSARITAFFGKGGYAYKIKLRLKIQ